MAAGDQKLVLAPHIFGARPEVGQMLVLTMENDPAHGWDRFEWSGVCAVSRSWQRSCRAWR